MRTALRSRWIAAALCVWLCACTQQKTVTASTQVMLRIYNNDPALLQQMSDLHVSFALHQNNTWHSYPTKSFAKKQLSWPVDIPILPSHKQDAFQQFEVVVQARAAKEPLAEMRAVSSFVPGERRVLEVWLYRCGGSDVPLICATSDCHGDQCEVCRPNGKCEPVGAVPGTDLPGLKDDKTPETKPDPLTGSDGSVVGDGSVAGDGSVGTDAMITLPMADCTTLICDGNAKCFESTDGPHCECLPGYEKVDEVCEDINECKQDDRGGCSPNATCDNNVGGRECKCKKGYTDTKEDGTECVDACELAKCDKNAICSIVEGAADCSCPPAYVGDGETSCTFDSACAELGCDVNAVCKVEGTTRKCECKPGYEGDGESCTNPDACKPNNPCLNGGVCSDGLGDFTCECVVAGFSGDTCETNDDDCAPSNPCMNGGVCKDLVDAFSCTCDGTGFSGDQCQMNVPDCPNGACMPGGVCMDAVKDYSCTCTAGFDLSNGGKACVNHDDCPGNTCGVNGQCKDGIQDYSCMCNPGYDPSGKTCVPHNDCVPLPCKNGAGCTDAFMDYTCNCSGTAHVGKNCDQLSGTCMSMVNMDCTSGVGACLRPGHYQCNGDGVTVYCDAVEGAKGTESCNAVDDDCDGDIDDGFPPKCNGQVAFKCADGPVNTDCAAQAGDGKTCLNNICDGDCAVGRRRCEPQGGAPQLCNNAGNWADVSPACSQPANICNKTTHLCVNNDPFSTPTNRTTASGGSSIDFGPQQLIASPVYVTEDVRLIELGLFAASESSGGLARAAIYRDTLSGTTHRPGALLDVAPLANSTGAGTSALFPVQNTNLLLMANTLYWVAVEWNVGTAPYLIEYSVTPQSNGLGNYYVGSANWNNPLPSTFPAATTFGGLEASLFIRVQRYWH